MDATNNTEKATNGNGHHYDESNNSSALVAAEPDHKNPNSIPDHSRALALQIAAMTHEEYAIAEKKLLRKIDLNLIPWMTLLYLMSFLDRVNVGAAKIVGLTTELNLDAYQYSIVSMIFFVSYVAFEVPYNLVLKKARPSRFIPFTMVCWAIFQTCMGAVHNYGQIVALRFCLGLFESGLFPGLNFYLTGWYRREEINRRCAVFFAGAVLAGAFGGIFGYAISLMNGVGGLEGWSWIFIIEGLLTFCIACASFWMVHDWPDQAKFLTPLEREMVLIRLKQEQGLASEGKFNKRVVFAALKDWKVYLLMACYIGAAEPLYSGSLFSPTIIASLGTFTVPQSLLLSTPPYVVSFCTTLGTAWLSDRYKTRGPFLIFWGTLCCIGYSILLGVGIKTPGAAYFAVFLTVMSTGPMIATTIAWTANTWGNHYKKAVAMGLVFSSGNSGGIVSSFAYKTNESPTYPTGHGVALGFSFMLVVTSIILTMWARAENKRRDAKYGPAPINDHVSDLEDPSHLQQWGLGNLSREEIVELGDKHPAFRYYP